MCYSIRIQSRAITQDKRARAKTQNKGTRVITQDKRTRVITQHIYDCAIIVQSVLFLAPYLVDNLQGNCYLVPKVHILLEKSLWVLSQNVLRNDYAIIDLIGAILSLADIGIELAMADYLQSNRNIGQNVCMLSSKSLWVLYLSSAYLSCIWKTIPSSVSDDLEQLIFLSQKVCMLTCFCIMASTYVNMLSNTDR